MRFFEKIIFIIFITIIFIIQLNCIDSEENTSHLHRKLDLKLLHKIDNLNIKGSSEICFSPDGNFIYISSRNCNILIFKINRDNNTLTQIDDFIVTGINNLLTIIVSPDGNYLYTLSDYYIIS
jgi:WD40 repeat protein